MSMRDRLVPDDLVADQKPAVIWYDKKAIDQWRENLPNLTDLIDFRPLPHRYKSNWRILHIDGFECRPILFFGSQRLEFFADENGVEV